jgi:hypothetical protein
MSMDLDHVVAPSLEVIDHHIRQHKCSLDLPAITYECACLETRLLVCSGCRDVMFVCVKGTKACAHARIYLNKETNDDPWHLVDGWDMVPGNGEALT